MGLACLRGAFSVLDRGDESACTTQVVDEE